MEIKNACAIAVCAAASYYGQQKLQSVVYPCVEQAFKALSEMAIRAPLPCALGAIYLAACAGVGYFLVKNQPSWEIRIPFVPAQNPNAQLPIIDLNAPAA